MIRADNKRNLLERIDGLNGCNEVYINLRPTQDILEVIVSQCPNLKKIICPPSLHRQTAKKSFKFAEEAGIVIEAGDIPVGRPKKYEEETIQEIYSQKSGGKPVKKIAEDMEIPLRTVYFYLKSGGK